MVEPHHFETESGILEGALGALLVRGLDEGLCPDSWQEYCLFTLLHEQARKVHQIGMELLFRKP